MDAISTVKLEYLKARETLLQKHSRNGVQLCARGRVYRAMAMAPNFKAEAMPKFEEQFNLFSSEAQTLIDDYNFATRAYEAFAIFGGERPVWAEIECDCEGCQLQ